MVFIFEFFFGKIAGALDGYKVKIGAAGSILVGISGLIGHFFPDAGCPEMDVEKALGWIASGWIVWGGNHKMQKLIDK
jgi:hypothetical protein